LVCFLRYGTTTIIIRRILMATVQPITTLNIDGVAFNVADLSAQVQALVGVYNDWNQSLADAQSKAALNQAALNDLSRQIIQTVKADQDAAAAAANDAAAPAATTDAAPTASDVPASVN
jgi:hypothetical protein